MSRIVMVQISDTEKGTSQQRKFIVRNRSRLVAAINDWLTSTAEPALDAAALPEDIQEV